MSYNPTREEIVAELEQLDRLQGSGNAQFVDYKRLAHAYIALLDECENLRRDKEALDWLIENMDCYYSRENQRIVIRTTDHDFMQDPAVSSGANLREAIDAAISENAPE